MKKLITTNILLNELSKYGSFNISDNHMSYTVSEALLNETLSESDVVDITSLRQDTKDLRSFLNICSMCFIKGFNPIIDKVNNQAYFNK